MRNSKWTSTTYLFLITLVFLSFQNCSSQYQLEQSQTENFLDYYSTQAPVITFNPTTAQLINSDNQSVQFTIDFEQNLIRSVTCQIGNQSSVDCSSGTFELESLIDGDHTLRVIATTTYGISGENSILIRKDSSSPTVLVSQSPPTQTALTNAQFTFSTSDLLSGVERIECSLNQAEFSSCTSPHMISGLTSGNHNLRIRAIDRATNVSSIYSYNWLIDTSVPTVVISSGPSLFSNSTTATFVFSGVGVQSFQCQLGTAAYTNCTSPHMVSNLAPNVAHTVRIRGINSVGVTGTPTVYNWTHDSMAPTSPILTSANPAITTQRNNSVSFSSQDSGSGLARFECLNSGQFTTCTSPSSFTNQADGNYTVQVRAIDQAGNISTTSSVNWIVDTTEPVIAFSQTPVSTTTATQLTFSFTATDARTTVTSLRCSVNMASFTDCTSPLTTAQLLPGSHNFRIQAVDQAGNRAEITHLWTQSAASTPDPQVPNNMRMVFMATGHQARTIMSCDDGRTWINDRSDNPLARCWVEGNPNYVECDHTPTSSRGIDSANGWFYTSYGWGYPGSARRSRDGVNWEIINRNRTSIGIIITDNGQLTWFSDTGNFPTSTTQGQSWSVTNPPGNYFLGRSVAKVGNKIWISSDDVSRALYSPDGGLTIQSVTIPNLNREIKIAEGNGVMVMLSSRFQNNIYTAYSMRSTDGGITWTSQTVFSGAAYLAWSDLIFNGAEFVTWAGNQRFSTRDGQTWTQTPVSIPINTIEGSVAYNPITQTYSHISNRWGNFYAGQKAYRSTNGINWTELPAQAFPGGHPISKIIAAPMESRFCP